MLESSTWSYPTRASRGIDETAEAKLGNTPRNRFFGPRAKERS
jgi:hypothetical protein